MILKLFEVTYTLEFSLPSAFLVSWDNEIAGGYSRFSCTKVYQRDFEWAGAGPKRGLVIIQRTRNLWLVNNMGLTLEEYFKLTLGAE